MGRDAVATIPHGHGEWPPFRRPIREYFNIYFHQPDRATEHSVLSVVPMPACWRQPAWAGAGEVGDVQSALGFGGWGVGGLGLGVWVVCARRPKREGRPAIMTQARDLSMSMSMSMSMSRVPEGKGQKAKGKRTKGQRAKQKGG